MKVYPKWFLLSGAACLLLILFIETLSYPHMLARVAAGPAPAWVNVLIVDSLAVVFWGLCIFVWGIPKAVPQWWKGAILASSLLVIALILSINLNWK